MYLNHTIITNIITQYLRYVNLKHLHEILNWIYYDDFQKYVHKNISNIIINDAYLYYIVNNDKKKRILR